MNRVAATELCRIATNYIDGISDLQPVPIEIGARGFDVTGIYEGGIVRFRELSDVRNHPGYDPQLPAKRRAEGDLRYRTHDFEKDGARIITQAEEIVALLRRLADRIEVDLTAAKARRDVTLPALTDRDAARRHEDNYDSLARRTMDELDFIRTASVNRNFGDARVDLARSSLQLRHLLPQAANEDGDTEL